MPPSRNLALRAQVALDDDLDGIDAARQKYLGRHREGLRNDCGLQNASDSHTPGMLGGRSAAPPDPRSLIALTRPYAKEQTPRSWYYVLSTTAILTAALTLAALAPWP